MGAFKTAIPYGDILLMCIVICFAMSSMFSYSFYGTTCANYLFGTRRGRYYVWFFLATLVIFAIVPLETAVGFCDLFYALMAIPTMIAVISLSKHVRRATKEYFNRQKS
ncbi:MAG: alanine:cation symporter family protein, partial [Muribaculaceae bacterium]|nr:alanine:cation symporter family protein [Muribaculaceae bacterium]